MGRLKPTSSRMVTAHLRIDLPHYGDAVSARKLAETIQRKLRTVMHSDDITVTLRGVSDGAGNHVMTTDEESAVQPVQIQVIGPAAASPGWRGSVVVGDRFILNGGVVAQVERLIGTTTSIPQVAYKYGSHDQVRVITDFRTLIDHPVFLQPEERPDFDIGQQIKSASGARFMVLHKLDTGMIRVVNMTAAARGASDIFDADPSLFREAPDAD